MIPEELVFEKDGIEFMKLCCDITVYWVGSVFEHVEGVLRFHEKAMELIGPDVRFYETGEMAGALPREADTLSLVPQWLQRCDRRLETYMLTLETHPLPNMPSDKALDFWAVEYPEIPVGAMRLVLPVSYAEDAPESLVSLTRMLSEKLDFHSGHAGYAVNWDYKGEYAAMSRGRMSRFARRFQGVDLPDIACTLCAIPSGFKCVNWLTLLGKELLAGAGGPDELRSRLPAGIHRGELGKGVLIQAGAKPGLGDVNRRDFLPAYHAVGRALEELRSREHPPFLKNSRGVVDEDVTEEWLGRFDS